MFDRTDFWPPAPDWTELRLQAEGLTITAMRLDAPAFILSGQREAVEAFASTFMTTRESRLLRFAPDRFLLLPPDAAGLRDGWHKGSVAVTAADGIYILIDVRGAEAMALLSVGAMSIAMMKEPVAASVLSFAGVTVLFEPQEDGARLYAEHPQAAYLWQWLQAAVSGKDMERS